MLEDALAISLSVVHFAEIAAVARRLVAVGEVLIEEVEKLLGLSWPD